MTPLSLSLAEVKLPSARNRTIVIKILFHATQFHPTRWRINENFKFENLGVGELKTTDSEMSFKEVSNCIVEVNMTTRSSRCRPPQHVPAQRHYHGNAPRHHQKSPRDVMLSQVSFSFLFLLTVFGYQSYQWVFTTPTLSLMTWHSGRQNKPDTMAVLHKGGGSAPSLLLI